MSSITTSDPIEHIVLGVDEGDYSWETLEMARALATSVGAEVRGFHATDDRLPDAVVQRAEAAGLPLFSHVTGAGVSSAGAILDHAAGLTGAVVALTSHARRGLTSALLGSTAAAILQESSEPILLFGPHHESSGEITRVLACVDGSDHSESILPAACRWARASGSALWLVHVVEEADSIAVGGADSNYLQRITQELDTGDIDIEFDVLHGHRPGRSIADYANDCPGTLTALATHGRTGIRDITMGSVAMEVTRRSHGATVVVRPG